LFDLQLCVHCCVTPPYLAAVAQSLGTTFVYDFVDMFHFHAEIYLKGLDALGAEKKGAGFRQPSGPCFHAAEMVLNSEVGSRRVQQNAKVDSLGFEAKSQRCLPSGRDVQALL
jgi:hypothetical protein